VEVMLDGDLAAPTGRAGDEVRLAVAVTVKGFLDFVALEVVERLDVELLDRRLVDEIAFQRAAFGNRADELGTLRIGALVGIVQREPAIDPKVEIALGDGLVEGRIVERGRALDGVAELLEKLLVDFSVEPAGVP